MQRREFLRVTVAGSAICAAPLVSAQPAGNRQLVLLVGNASGSPPDVRARELGQALAPVLGQPVIIINKPGASGMLAAREAARAAPDGQTVFLISVNQLINEAIDPPATRLPVLDNFELVTSLSGAPLILFRNPGVPVKGARDLVEYARQNPGKLTYATGGTGSIEQLYGAAMFGSLGIDLREVPYPAATKGILDVIGGTVNLGFAYPVTIGQHLSTERVKAIGIGSTERLSAVPDVPTFAEQGVSAPTLNAWQGLAVSKGTPPAVIGKLYEAVHTVLTTPKFRAKWVADGAIIGGDRPEAFTETVRAQREQIASVVKKYGIARQ